MNIRDALLEASDRIATQDARRDAEVLLAHLLRCDRAWLFAHPETSIDAGPLALFRSLATRRAAHEPLQYITGEQEFYGLKLRVTPDVLIPRPETEHLVEAVLLWATRFHDERTLRIADVGTGSGAIAIALATHLAGAAITAIDVSQAALAVARENARAHGCGERIRFVQGDLLGEGCQDLDAVVSNPPYVAEREAASLQPDVAGYEPHVALFGGEDGLAVYRRLIPAAHAALRAGGLLALEIGQGQRAAVAELLEDWNDVRFIDDYQSIPRVALAMRA